MYIIATPMANFFFLSPFQVHLVQYPFSFTVCCHQILLSVGYTQVVVQAPRLHFFQGSVV